MMEKGRNNHHGTIKDPKTREKGLHRLATKKHKLAIPRAIDASKAHEGARSFKASEIDRYEKTRAYRDLSLNWLLASRGVIPCQVVDSWDSIRWPMNQGRTARITIVGAEVAAAYNTLFKLVSVPKVAKDSFGENAEHFLKCRWILTTEEDNIIPDNAVTDLLGALHECPDCGSEIGSCCATKKTRCKNCKEWRCPKGHKGYDAVSGLYSVKADPPIPMVFGDPKVKNDFKPRSVKAAMKTGKIVEVNGIPMGCAIFRKELFRSVKQPWFTTSTSHTQDLFFCRKAKEQMGARFAVHTGVRVGHLDPASGVIF